MKIKKNDKRRHKSENIFGYSRLRDENISKSNDNNHFCVQAIIQFHPGIPIE